MVITNLQIFILLFSCQHNKDMPDNLGKNFLFSSDCYLVLLLCIMHKWKLKKVYKKNVDIKFSAHDAFLE